MGQARAWFSRQIREVLVVDLRALALLRMGLAISVLTDLALRFPDARDLYSDAGVLPRSAASPPAFWGFRLYFLSGDEGWVMTCMAITAVVAVAWGLGWFSRVANVALWLLMGSLQLRNMLVLHGGDDLLLSFLFWTMFVPTGGRWSLDVRRRGLRVASPLVGFPALALYLQLFLLYFATGTLKASQPHWWLGNGVYEALSADYVVTSWGRALYPHWYLLKLLSWLTLVIEIALPLLMLGGPRAPRARTALALLFIGFHLGIGASLQVGVFSLVSMVCWLFTLPREAMDKIESWLGLRAAASDLPEAKGRAVRVLAWAAGVCLALLVVSGAANDRLAKGTLREVATYPTRFVRLQDRWGLFIGPRTDSGWFVIHGQTNSGADVDLMRAGAPLSWERPASVINAFPNQRWRKLITRFRHPHMKARLDQYLNWLCRSQPQGEPGAELRLLKFVYVSHRIGPRYDHGPEQRKQLGQAACR